MGGEVPVYIYRKDNFPPRENEESQGDNVGQLVQAFRYCESASDFETVIEGELVEDVRSAIALCENSRVLLQWWQAGEAPAASPSLAEGSKVKNRLGFAGVVRSIVSGQRVVVEFVGSVLGGQAFELPIEELTPV